MKVLTSLTPLCDPRELPESIRTVKRRAYLFHSSSMSAVACFSAAEALRPLTQ
jgi:hypothetical protein